MSTVADVCTYMEDFAPRALAESWDNVGLLLGDRTRGVTKLFTCLTITPEVVREVVTAGAEMIVCHHPILFKATKNLSANTTEGKLLAPLLAHNIAVYSPHTAFDNCIGGINDDLATRLGLQEVSPLRLAAMGDSFKLVVFVPTAETDELGDALFAAGAGRIGAYRQCSFRTPGFGTFFGEESTNPVIGTRGQREIVPENRLEVVVPARHLSAVIAALRASHIYEEPAFDIYPVKVPSTGGAGRVGMLAAPESLREVALRLRASLHANAMQMVGDPQRMIRKVAVACGAAGEFLADAIKAKADLFVCGEIRFHDGLAAQAANIAVLLPGHFASERPAVVQLATRLAAAFPNVAVQAAEEQDPFAVFT